MQGQPTCACGCGKSPKPGNTYLLGHNSQAAHVDYVEDESGCWVWQRSYWSASGRPRIKIDGRWVAAHRIYYARRHGPIEDGLTLDHLCANRRCVNPDHLEPCTLGENQRRAGNKVLTDAEVRDLRTVSDETHAEAAKRLGCDVATVVAARLNKTHRSVPYDPFVAEWYGIQGAVLLPDCSHT